MMQHRRKVLLGSASNLTKLLLTAPFALILPPLFVRVMIPAEYSAWMLILQCSAYINFLDLGLQTAVSKFIAQYDAAGDRTAASRTLSSSFAILCVSSLVGSAIIVVATWLIPELFDQMPPDLIASTREGLLLVGISTAFLLPFNVFISAFIGLQRYGFSTIVSIVSKSLLSAALMVLILFHADIAQLAWLMTCFNVGTAALQFLGWRKYLRNRMDFAPSLIHKESIFQLAKYGSMLSVWTIAMLFISGLDMLIVGHFDYKNTAYYGTATAVANFMLLIIVSVFGPLIPAVSSLQVGSTPGTMGTMVISATRVCALVLCLVGLPILVGAYPTLTLWVGHEYAVRSASFLEVLIIGNAIRQLCYPYSLVVVATGIQHQAIIAGVAEALVNVAASIYLVQRIGAIGVALGTVLGALVSIGVHVGVSMKQTQSSVLLSRWKFVNAGLLRPLACVIPTLALLPFWKKLTTFQISPIWVGVWAPATLSIMWFVGLMPAERYNLKLRFVQLAQRWHGRG